VTPSPVYQNLLQNRINRSRTIYKSSYSSWCKRKYLEPYL